jgi:hypothetical protein
MGWWSTDIMGGDSPLDAKDEIFGICHVEEFPETGTQVSLTKEDISNNLPKILEYVRSQANNPYYDEKAIAYQVLGVLMMKAGAEISPELKTEILEASDTDSWSETNDDRARTVQNFHKAIEAYDNVNPVLITSRGLFETMFGK